MRAREDREVGWPADQVERWPIDRLIPYAKNSRTHSEAQIAQLAASMKEWGWTNPVLADEAGEISKGSYSPLSRARIMRTREGREYPWPADQVERWPIDRLIPYAKNSRTHSEAQIAQLAASMKEWGLTNPVLADEAGGVIAGHARILAARQLGYAEVPVMVARGWSDAQKRADVIADNQLALNAGWDRELLGLEFGELKLGGF